MSAGWRPRNSPLAAAGAASGSGSGPSTAPRRHSITVATGLQTSAEFKELSKNRNNNKRRQSIQESLQSLTNSLQKAMHIGGSISSLHPHVSQEEYAKSRLTKNFFREVLSAHFNQPDLKVTKLILRHVPNPHTNQVLYEAEVFFKDSKGRRKLDLLIKYASNEKVGVCTGSSNNSASSSPYKGNNNGGTTSSPSVEHGWILDGTNDEMRRELKAYGTIIGDMWRYLREDKGVAEPERFLCLPQRYEGASLTISNKTTLSDVRESREDEEERSSTSATATGDAEDEILVLQDLFSAGYQPAAQDRADESGLDFNHSIMAVSRLARFHAVSYAMRKEKGLDLVEAYPFLAEDPVYRPDTEAMFAKTQNNIATRLFNIFQHSPQDIKVFSGHFLDAVRRLHEMQSAFVRPCDRFGVLCHGDLWRQNVLFFYGSSLESQTDCLDVRFEDLHRVRAASCVTDFLYFLFTTVDYDVRRDHMMDFLAVYHDHFSKTVAKLAPSVEMFSREGLFSEFRSRLMYGFLEGVCLFSTVYESQLHRLENEERTGSPSDDQHTIDRPRYGDYKEAVVAMIGDVIRLELQGRPSEASGDERRKKKAAN